MKKATKSSASSAAPRNWNGNHGSLMKLRFFARCSYIFVFVGGSILSFLAASYVHKSEQERNHALFERVAQRNFHAIETSLAWNLESLENIKYYFLSSQWVKQSEFNNFIDPLFKKETDYEAISWIMEIPRDELEHTQALLGIEGITLNPTNDHTAYPLRILTYSKPHEKFKRLAGYNIANDPALNAVIDKAASTRKTIFSIGDPALFGSHLPKKSYLMAVSPSFKNDQEQFPEGFALGIIDIGTTVEKIIKIMGEPFVGIKIISEDSTGSVRDVYETRDVTVKNTIYTHSEKIFFNEKKVTFYFSPTPYFLKIVGTYNVNILFAILMALTCVISFYIRQMIKQMHFLQEAQDRALEANRLKSEFLATMSHEIRSPMSGVLGMAELLIETDMTPEQTGYARTIINSGETLMNIIEDILDFSKIEADKIEFDPIPINMLELVDDLCALYAPKAREKALDLAVRYVPGSEQFVYADPVRVRQVLSNLINNAIKFTEKGYVIITVREDKSIKPGEKVNLVFTIEDTGIGIDTSAQHKIFEKFTQADSSTTRNFGGTGLGLSICKRLIEMMGGQIAIKSEKGKGCIFTFNLPLQRNTKEIQEQVRPPILKDVKVLVVDDLEVIRMQLTEQLSLAGMRCSSVSNGEEALQAMHQSIEIDDPFKMIIVDYLLPGMNGEMLARAIGDEPDFGDPCLVMLTAAGIPVAIETMARKGFSAYVAKPVSSRKIVETLAIVWSKFRGGSNDILIRVDAQSLGNTKKKDDPCLDGARVLLAEDSRINQAFAQDVLEQLGCVTVIVSNGKEALNKISEESFDLILMDCQMPVMDGFEATRAICNMKKEGKVNKSLPIIALTANAMKGDRQKCIDAGMNDYLSKPVRTKDLKEKIYYWIMHRRKAFKDPIDDDVISAHVNYASFGKKSNAQDKILSTAQLIDIPAMEEARYLLKDKYLSMLDYYFEDVTNYMEDIKTALGSGIMEDVTRPAHTIKSTSKRMGAARLSEIAMDMESAARDGGAPPDIMKQKLNEMIAVFASSKAALLQAERSKTG